MSDGAPERRQPSTTPASRALFLSDRPFSRREVASLFLTHCSLSRPIPKNSQKNTQACAQGLLERDPATVPAAVAPFVAPRASPSPSSAAAALAMPARAAAALSRRRWPSRRRPSGPGASASSPRSRPRPRRPSASRTRAPSTRCSPRRAPPRAPFSRRSGSFSSGRSSKAARQQREAAAAAAEALAARAALEAQEAAAKAAAAAAAAAAARAVAAAGDDGGGFASPEPSCPRPFAADGGAASAATLRPVARVPSDFDLAKFAAGSLPPRLLLPPPPGDAGDDCERRRRRPRRRWPRRHRGGECEDADDLSVFALREQRRRGVCRGRDGDEEEQEGRRERLVFGPPPARELSVRLCRSDLLLKRNFREIGEQCAAALSSIFFDFPILCFDSYPSSPSAPLILLFFSASRVAPFTRFRGGGREIERGPY